MLLHWALSVGRYAFRPYEGRCFISPRSYTVVKLGFGTFVVGQRAEPQVPGSRNEQQDSSAVSFLPLSM
jgi:hypothetical protein